MLPTCQHKVVLMTPNICLIVIRTRLKGGVYSRAMVRITECDLRPLPVDIPMSHHCVPEHSWNSLCSVYLGKTVHRLKMKNRIHCIALSPPPPPPITKCGLDLH